jgi:hypothetical protein
VVVVVVVGICSNCSSGGKLISILLFLLIIFSLKPLYLHIGSPGRVNYSEARKGGRAEAGSPIITETRSRAHEVQK